MWSSTPRWEKESEIERVFASGVGGMHFSSDDSGRHKRWINYAYAPNISRFIQKYAYEYVLYSILSVQVCFCIINGL